ncbi:MAG: glycosyltransferase [Clostridiales bacterium]|nr:glycosyltransferase [Clostridiales bacterium]
MPEISVIVPVYKVEPYLRRCVDSILNQTFQDFELILVDDGSPDHCPAICDEYAGRDSRIVVIHQKNAGLSAARNAGIDWVFANSDSKWISFVDSDDWVTPTYLSLMISALQIDSDIDMVQCTYEVVTAEKTSTSLDEKLKLWKLISGGGCSVHRLRYKCERLGEIN